MNSKSILMIAAAALFALAPACRSGGSGSEAVEAPEEDSRTVALSADAAAVAGLQTVPVEARSLRAPIRAFGVVRFDPRRRYRLTARVPGRIEELSAFEGTRVKAGQTLLALYSPDFLSSQSELLQMIERREMAARGRDPQETRMARGMLEAAEKKLRFLGLSDEEIRDLAQKKETTLLLPVKSPIAGTVNECPILAGSSVEAGALLMEISDLRTVWVEARVFERDMAALETGLPAEVELAALPGESFPGRLTVIGAALDESSRTAKAVIEVSNPAEHLRPGMSASVTIHPRRAATALTVPESAVRRVEGADVVFVAGPGGIFTAREVTVGRRLEGYVEILSGLTAGESVAGEGSLALKSELLKKNLEGD
jgi:Cu(I)/Ag(I) efflux system membrane fusion protein